MVLKKLVKDVHVSFSWMMLRNKFAQLLQDGRNMILKNERTHCAKLLETSILAWFPSMFYVKLCKR